MAELDLADTAPAPEPNALGQIWLLVRRRGVPVGSIVALQPGPLRAADLRPLARDRFDVPTPEHADPTPEHADPIPVARSAGPGLVSVVICTLGQEGRLRRAVASVLAQCDVTLELLVVDNDPTSGRVSRLLGHLVDPRLRIVSEPRRGLSWARNAGLAACRGSVVAFTDDDAYAEPGWLAHLTRPLVEAGRVVCATGLVLPAEIATRAQVWFEEFGAFDKGFEPVVWSAGQHPELSCLGRPGSPGPLFPYAAGVFGSGNNMAFDVGWLRSVGGFDVALGAGTPTRGGEDLDAFLRVMLGDRALVYEPRALIRHYARSGTAQLHQQLYGYGSGMSAVIAKYLLTRPRHAARIVARVPAGLRLLLDPRSTKNSDRSPGYPQSLARVELRGYLAGPFLYVRSRWRARRV
ncbi:MAG: hypothetical protein JWP61_443 [Friedmanniella sp.]|nr:hypothetical protein [Friedmanniella sp.]